MGIAWYLVVSALIFCIGAAGVLVRRNPLVILLCLELMLNAGNLALIAFEVASMLLLLAAVGAVVLAQRRREGAGGSPSEDTQSEAGAA